MHRPACGTMVPWSKMIRPIKIFSLHVVGTLGCSQRHPTNNLRSQLHATASFWHCGTLAKMTWPIKILFLRMLWALWAALRETLQITSDHSCMQQPACGTRVTWPKINRPVDFLPQYVVGNLGWSQRDLTNNCRSELHLTASLWHNGNLAQD